MSYRFPLATLLRFRESLEHAAWLELQEANQQVQRMEASLRQLEHECLEWRKERFLLLGKGVQVAELDVWGDQYHQRKRSELETHLLQAQQQAANMLTEFYEARQKRQILENVYLHGKKLYDTEQARREQARVDELFLLRRGRSKQN